MPKFRKKVPTVEAWQWNGESIEETEIVRVGGTREFVNDKHENVTQPYLVVKTGHGTLPAFVGDWIVTDDNETYPVDPVYFAEAYEQVYEAPEGMSETRIHSDDRLTNEDLNDLLDCPRMGCSVGSFPARLATRDEEGNLRCPRCGAVVLSAYAQVLELTGQQEDWK